MIDELNVVVTSRNEGSHMVEIHSRRWPFVPRRIHSHHRTLAIVPVIYLGHLSPDDGNESDPTLPSWVDHPKRGVEEDA